MTPVTTFVLIVQREMNKERDTSKVWVGEQNAKARTSFAIDTQDAVAIAGIESKRPTGKRLQEVSSEAEDGEEGRARGGNDVAGRTSVQCWAGARAGPDASGGG